MSVLKPTSQRSPQCVPPFILQHILMKATLLTEWVGVPGGFDWWALTSASNLPMINVVEKTQKESGGLGYK